MLLDQFGRNHHYLRVSLTPVCNMACTYCSPIFLSGNHQFTPKETFFRQIQFLCDLGIDTIKLTGGEPLLYPELIPLLTSLKSISKIKKISLTTNGLLLPEKWQVLIASGLTSLNISLDAVQSDLFYSITKRNSARQIIHSIKEISNYIPVKINSVLLPDHYQEQIDGLIEYFKNDPIRLRFIEFMPFENNLWEEKKVINEDIVKSYLFSKQFQLTYKEKEGPARYFSLQHHPLTIGFISTVSQHFCSDCNRLRLTHDGKLFNCIFQTEGLAFDENNPEFETEIRNFVYGKYEFHNGKELTEKTQVLSMRYLGG